MGPRARPLLLHVQRRLARLRLRHPGVPAVLHHRALRQGGSDQVREPQPTIRIPIKLFENESSKRFKPDRSLAYGGIHFTQT